MVKAHFIGYSFLLAARDLLYAPYHRLERHSPLTLPTRPTSQIDPLIKHQLNPLKVNYTH